MAKIAQARRLEIFQQLSSSLAAMPSPAISLTPLVSSTDCATDEFPEDFFVGLCVYFVFIIIRTPPVTKFSVYSADRVSSTQTVIISPKSPSYLADGQKSPDFSCLVAPEDYVLSPVLVKYAMGCPFLHIFYWTRDEERGAGRLLSSVYGQLQVLIHTYILFVFSISVLQHHGDCHVFESYRTYPSRARRSASVIWYVRSNVLSCSFPWTSFDAGSRELAPCRITYVLLVHTLNLIVFKKNYINCRCCSGGTCELWDQATYSSGSNTTFTDFCNMDGSLCTPEGNVVTMNLVGMVDQHTFYGV